VIRASFGKSAAGRLLIGAGALALLTTAISGCEAGNDAPTLEFHPAAAGSQATVNGIKISNVFVLGAPSGSTVPAGSSAGLFLSLWNGRGTGDTLQGATATGTAGTVSLGGGQVALPAYSGVNLTGPTPSVVLNNLSKPLSAGGYVSVTLNFEHAGMVKLQVPVEPQSYYWATYSPPASAAASSTSTSPSSITSTAGTATPTPSATAS
jgi:copper(I)-binding protein